jgi:hypothetical protein
MTDLDWREMFRRYAEHVGAQEGVYFLWEPGARNAYGVEMQTPWTPEEWEAIAELMRFEPVP